MEDSPGKRLALFRAQAGLSQRALADALEVSNAAVGQIESDARAPSKGFLVKISDRYGVNSDWLLNGHGNMLRPAGSGFSGRTIRVEQPDSDVPGHGDLRIQSKDYTWVRRMGLSVSAGSGLVVLSPEDEDGLVLPNEWLQRLGVNPDLCSIISVRGDSMAPTIPDGSMVILHSFEREVRKPGIYAFVLEDHAFIKRLVPSEFDGNHRPTAITILSDNPAYPPKVLIGKKINDLKVAGRVRAVFSEV